jgi:DNA-binding response OmpR family regulator
MMPKARERPLRILCLSCSSKRLTLLQAALERPRYFTLAAATSEAAVAVCVSESVVAAVVDAESLRGQEWTVVKSLKAIRPTLPVILVDQRKEGRESSLPEGVDAVASISSPAELFNVIDRLVSKTEPSVAI